MKQISTFIATVILILLTVAIGVTLYLYFSGYLTGIAGLTEQQQAAFLECRGLMLDLDYKSGTSSTLTLYIVNLGNTTIDGKFVVRVEYSDKNTVVQSIDLGGNLGPGNVTSYNVSGLASGTVTKVTITPIGKCQIPFSRIKEVTIS